MWKFIRENEYKNVYDLCGFADEHILIVCLRKECEKC